MKLNATDHFDRCKTETVIYYLEPLNKPGSMPGVRPRLTGQQCGCIK